MTEAIFGLIGVVIGSFITWCQSYYMNRQLEIKNAKYLAIRVVCILDKFMDDCADVVNDDGLCMGQKNEQGCLEAQVSHPSAPLFPDDVDWKSIDHELMYKILSFSSDIASANKIIDSTWEFTGPPDFEEWFEERKFHYAKFGLHAYELADELCERYEIKKKTYNDWDPKAELKRELKLVNEKREKRILRQQSFVDKVIRKE
ncbi:hypothetical protein [Flavobacterium anhuiense]|uniref:hypothetical protein n=1 Tax=Flavobacterium anhuiense TaxID=459526 RepID=UPI003D9614FE